MVIIPPLVAQYLVHAPDEAPQLSRLTDLLAHTPSSNDLIARTNFVGHVTASGFILNASKTAVLLVYHKGLQMYVQPGGHLDLTDGSPIVGARREVLEETGLGNLHLIALHSDADVPFDIDSHYIPPNPQKREPEHWHHDFRYAFVCSADSAVALDTNEVVDARWVSLQDLGHYPTMARVASKLLALASDNSRGAEAG